MLAFNLNELHDHWDALKQRGRLAAHTIPLPVQAALTALGLASLDWVAQDLVITKAGAAGLKTWAPLDRPDARTHG